jgi:hypothetical protein
LIHKKLRKIFPFRFWYHSFGPMVSPPKMVDALWESRSRCALSQQDLTDQVLDHTQNPTASSDDTDSNFCGLLLRGFKAHAAI